MSKKLKGIYCYIDEKDNSIVYIGKDSNIGINKRHYAHIALCNYDKQWINRIVQNNPERYDYEVLLEGNISEKLLNAYEMAFIRMYDPKFNFTDGGDGKTGWRKPLEDFKYVVVKKGKDRNGKKRYGILGRDNSTLISSIDKNYLESFLYLLNSDEEAGLKAIKKASNSGGLSKETKNRISKSNKYDFARIVKNGIYKYTGKQNYCIKRDGKTLKISINRAKLLDWFTANYPNEILILNIDKE